MKKNTDTVEQVVLALNTIGGGVEDVRIGELKQRKDGRWVVTAHVRTGDDVSQKVGSAMIRQWFSRLQGFTQNTILAGKIGRRERGTGTSRFVWSALDVAVVVEPTAEDLERARAEFEGELFGNGRTGWPKLRTI